MDPRPTVAVAVPAYNEAEGIAGFVTDLDVALGDLASMHTLVVVDDHSTDETSGVLSALSGTLAGTLVVLVAPVNRGHGPTVMSAYEHCVSLGTDLIVQVDGDGQFDPAELSALFERWAAGADIVTGNRTGREEPWFRAVVSRGLRVLVRVGFGVRRRDTNCPFRLYRAPVLAELLRQVPRDALVPHVELTILEARSAFRTEEVDVEHLARRGADQTGTMWQGRNRFAAPVRLARFCLRALREVVRFRLSLRRADRARSAGRIHGEVRQAGHPGLVETPDDSDID